MRYSFITAALDAAVPFADVQEAASHADARSTMRYDHRAAVSVFFAALSSAQNRISRHAATGPSCRA